MASDNDDDTTSGKLDKREEFPGWKAKMQLSCIEKGDNDGIFFDAGSDPAIGYRAYQGQGSVAKKETWVNLSKKLVGKVGNKISNGQLRRIWTTELTRILQIPAELPYIFAKCMAKLESECARTSETASQTARAAFTIALKSFVDSTKAKRMKIQTAGTSSGEGFLKYADGIRDAEEKLRTYGVNMSDSEKKQLFFQHFAGAIEGYASASWTTLLTVWMQQSNLTFDDILARGVAEQQQIDLRTSTAEAGGVGAYLTIADGEYEGDYRYTKKRRTGGRGNGETAGAYYFSTGKGKGGGKGKGRGGKFGRGRGGGRYGGRGRDQYVDESAIQCYNCGGYGHKSPDCPSKKPSKNSKGKGGGKGGKSKGGKGRGIVIPGMMAYAQATNTTFEPYGIVLSFLVTFVIELVVSLAFEYATQTTLLSGTYDDETDDTFFQQSAMMTLAVPPLVMYGKRRINNRYNDATERFTIKANSVIKDEIENGVIFDTGASMHVLNDERFMTSKTPNTCYEIVGVSGTDNSEYVGVPCITFWGELWDDGSYVPVTITGESNAAPNALLSTSAPLSLISWSAMKKKGWKVLADISGMYHEKYRVTIYFEERDGLSYMPVVEHVEHADRRLTVDSAAMTHVTATAYPAAASLRKLSKMTQYYVTFGGPDVTRLRKTGEILNLDLSGDVPPMIREFAAAKLKRKYPAKRKPTEYKPFECVVWDMQGPFKTKSIGGCKLSHDAVCAGTNLRFVYPVTDASAETFVEVLTQFIALIGIIPGQFVLKIVRADQGSNYKSKLVQQFLNRKGVSVQYAAVHTPHMIRRGEANHAILNATMRSIMSFAYAPRNTWALARKYSAVLNNFLATKYNTPGVFVPWHKLGVPLDVEGLLPFGCLVIMHKAKEQVDDGYVDQRGEYGVFVGWAHQEGEKAISVLKPNEKYPENTVFYKADVSYFPWRPDGQRRLLNDGTFGDEGETVRIFPATEPILDFNELCDDFEAYVTNGDDDEIEGVVGIEGVVSGSYAPNDSSTKADDVNRKDNAVRDAFMQSDIDAEIYMEPPIEMNDVTEGHDGAGAQKAMCRTSSHGVHDTLTACDGPEAPEARDELPEKLPEKTGVNDTFLRQEPRQLIPGPVEQSPCW